ncbi:MAG: O-antigen ligase family protein [Elusimicrobia bacterium]|nr:O-antigen ligase family protein [Elusimicrobiota bacterium]
MPIVSGLNAFFLLVAHFVCPLLFFTNFTRNPYQTQITLLQLSILILIALALVAWAKKRVLSSPLERAYGLSRRAIFLPLAGFGAICAASWAHSWLTHTPFFRPSILAEGMRIHLFLLVNMLLAVAVGYLTGRRCRGNLKDLAELDYPAIMGGLFFGLGWLVFHRLRLPNPSNVVDSPMAFLWDPYGFFLWASILAWLGYRWSRRGAPLLFSINYLIGVLASIYGLGQYFGVDFIWPRNMNPYGSRAISTFGNPNFLSPYLAMLIPNALAGFWLSPKTFNRVVFGAFFLIYEAGLLATLTRSSWAAAAVGLLAAMVLIWRVSSQSGVDMRAVSLRNRYVMVLFALGLGLFVAWPQGSQKRTPNAVGRLFEVQKIFEKDQENPKNSYQPFTQRYLIWSSGWRMAQERPVLGKGWGTFELFYPFYQSDLLYTPMLEGMRTHANNGHNEFMEVWSQTGTLGMGVYLWFFVFLFVWGIKNLRSLGSYEDRVIVSGMLAALAGMLVDNQLNVSMHFAMPGYLFWWMLGLCVALYPPPAMAGFNRDETAVGKFWWRWIAAAGVTAALFLVAVNVGRYWLSDFYFFRGFSLHREGNLAAAIGRLERSFKLYPWEVNRNYEMGNVYMRMGFPEKAVWGYAEALKANAGYDEIFFNRGTVLAGLGRIEEAHQDYLTSLYVNPTGKAAYNYLTNIVYLKDPPRHAAEAVDLLERALHFYPGDRDFLNNLGSFYSQMGNDPGAARCFFEALKSDPGYPIAKANLQGVILNLVKGGKTAEAKNWWQRWSQEMPGSAPSWGFPGSP